MEKKMEIRERRSLEQKGSSLTQNRKSPTDAIKSTGKECGSSKPSRSFFRMDYQTGKVVRLRGDVETRGYAGSHGHAGRKGGMPVEMPAAMHRREPTLSPVHFPKAEVRGMSVPGNNLKAYIKPQKWDGYGTLDRKETRLDGRLPVGPTSSRQPNETVSSQQPNGTIPNWQPNEAASGKIPGGRQPETPPVTAATPIVPTPPTIPVVPTPTILKGEKLGRNREQLRAAKPQEVEKKERHLDSVDKVSVFLDRTATFQGNWEQDTAPRADIREYKDREYGEETEEQLNEMFGIPKGETGRAGDREEGLGGWNRSGNPGECEREGKPRPPEYKVCKRPLKVERVSGLKEAVQTAGRQRREERLDSIFGKRAPAAKNEEGTTPTEPKTGEWGDGFREEEFPKKDRKKKGKEGEKEETSKLQKKGKERIGRERKVGRTVALAKQGKYLLDVADKEMASTYDAEERRKSATKDFLQKKLKERVAGRAKRQVKKASLALGNGLKNMMAALLKKAAVAIAPIAPYIAAGAAILCLFIGIIGALAEYDRQQQEAGSNAGFFGKMFFWIEYETGKTDDSAFATVLGDGGRAFGIQFDYRYTLQPFIRHCHTKNPAGYSPFAPYLHVDKNTLKGNQGLADAWTLVFYTNKEEFINDQKEYARVNYYDGIEAKAEQFGLRLKGRDETCKGAVLSYSFQCGSNAAYQAVRELTSVEGDEEFLRQIYALRTARYPRFAKRYERELQTALALLNSFLPGTGEFICPVDMTKCMVTSEFGEYRSPSDPSHNGIDLASYGGVPVPVHAIADGVVETAGFSPSAGNWAVIDHGNGIKAKYMHHSSIRVAVGQKVRKGEQIGNMGSTGQSTGVHLHLQVELNGVPVNPRNYITIP